MHTPSSWLGLGRVCHVSGVLVSVCHLSVCHVWHVCRVCHVCLVSLCLSVICLCVVCVVCLVSLCLSALCLCRECLSVICLELCLVLFFVQVSSVSASYSLAATWQFLTLLWNVYRRVYRLFERSSCGYLEDALLSWGCAFSMHPHKLKVFLINFYNFRIRFVCVWGGGWGEHSFLWE